MISRFVRFVNGGLIVGALVASLSAQVSASDPVLCEVTPEGATLCCETLADGTKICTSSIASTVTPFDYETPTPTVTPTPTAPSPTSTPDIFPLRPHRAFMPIAF